MNNTLNVFDGTNSNLDPNIRVYSLDDMMRFAPALNGIMHRLDFRSLKSLSRCSKSWKEATDDRMAARSTVTANNKGDLTRSYTSIVIDKRSMACRAVLPDVVEELVVHFAEMTPELYVGFPKITKLHLYNSLLVPWKYDTVTDMTFFYRRFELNTQVPTDCTVFPNIKKCVFMIENVNINGRYDEVQSETPGAMLYSRFLQFHPTLTTLKIVDTWGHWCDGSFFDVLSHSPIETLDLELKDTPIRKSEMIVNTVNTMAHLKSLRLFCSMNVEWIVRIKIHNLESIVLGQTTFEMDAEKFHDWIPYSLKMRKFHWEGDYYIRPDERVSLQYISEQFPNLRCLVLTAFWVDAGEDTVFRHLEELSLTLQTNDPWLTINACKLKHFEVNNAILDKGKCVDIMKRFPNLESFEYVYNETSLASHQLLILFNFCFFYRRFKLTLSRHARISPSEAFHFLRMSAEKNRHDVVMMPETWKPTGFEKCLMMYIYGESHKFVFRPQ